MMIAFTIKRQARNNEQKQTYGQGKGFDVGLFQNPISYGRVT